MCTAVLEAVVQQMPPPRGQRDQPLRALIFDSHYDAYKGVVAYVRVMDGSMRDGPGAAPMSTGHDARADRDRHLPPGHAAHRSAGGGRSGLRRHRPEDRRRVPGGRHVHLARQPGRGAAARLPAR